MIWRAVRHNLISEMLTWVVLLVLAAVIGALGLHPSIPTTVFTLAMFVLFAYIYRVVSKRL